MLKGTNNTVRSSPTRYKALVVVQRELHVTFSSAQKSKSSVFGSIITLVLMWVKYLTDTYRYFNLKYSVILAVLYFDSVYVIFLLHKAESQQFCFLSGLKVECPFVEWEGEGLNALAVIKALLQDITSTVLDHKGYSGCVCNTVGVTLALLLHQLMRLSAL